MKIGRPPALYLKSRWWLPYTYHRWSTLYTNSDTRYVIQIKNKRGPKHFTRPGLKFCCEHCLNPITLLYWKVSKIRLFRWLSVARFKIQLITNTVSKTECFIPATIIHCHKGYSEYWTFLRPRLFFVAKIEMSTMGTIDPLILNRDAV